MSPTRATSRTRWRPEARYARGLRDERTPPHEKEAALAHIELPEFSTKCIECLVDIPSIPDEEKEAAAKYLEEHRGEIQKNAEEIVDGYIRNALTEFFDDDRVIHG